MKEWQKKLVGMLDSGDEAEIKHACTELSEDDTGGTGVIEAKLAKIILTMLEKNTFRA